jgi:dTMP kinase
MADTPPPPQRGRFITLEGGEGAGKSTQTARLEAALKAAGIAVLRTREPGGAPGADILRELLLSGRHDWAPLAEVMLHFAARAEHIARTIAPALDAGIWVICDRFADSTMVYQGWGLGADRAKIAELTNLLPVAPDLTLVLDVTVATTQARLASRGLAADRYERLGADFFARVRAGFLAVAEADPSRCVVISGEDDADVVTDALLEAVRRRFPSRAASEP